MVYRTLRDLYINSIKAYGPSPAFSMYQGESLTYTQFGERVQEVAQLFLEAGLSSGDKVALLSNNMPNWPVCYFAAVVSGLVIVPILPDFSGPELDKIIRHSDAKALLVSDKLFSKVSKETVDDMNIVLRTKNLGIIAQKQCEPGCFTEPVPDDVAAIIYTSGTMSEPKGVMLTHYNLTSQIAMDDDLYPIGPEDIFLSILPLSHTYECSIGMIFPFMKGCSVIYLDKLPTPSTLMPALKEVRPTIMLSVPLIIEKIYRSQIAAKFNKKKFTKRLYGMPFFRKIIHKYAGKKLNTIFGGRLRFFGIGGAKLEAETERFLMEGKFPYAIGYGLTETAPLIAGAIPWKVKFRSTGPVLKGVEFRLENVNPETGEGEIVVKSPSTMKGYYKNPAATADVFTTDGWFRTKDLASVDSDGNLFIKGRLNSMIVGPSGENIYPEEIESVINSHFLVTDSIVTEEKGKLVALVRFNKDELEQKYYDLKEEWGHKMDDIKKEVMNYVNSKVARFSHISHVEEQPDDFEKTPTMKIKRFLYNKPGKKKSEGEKK